MLGLTSLTSEWLPWLVRSPAWINTSPGGNLTVRLCVSEMQTNRVLRVRVEVVEV